MAIQTMPTLGELLAVIARLPEPERRDFTAALEDAMALRPGPRELALGVLALDLAPHAVIDIAAEEREPAGA